VSKLDGALRIGILGAARIADEGIVMPARGLGHRVVAVAARERSRGEAFARSRGVEKVLDTYQELIEDPEVDVVYNALVNSLHAGWNSSALRAGKQVLSEKPFASNAAEAAAVRDVARESTGLIVEGFHYLHHPVNQRLRELVTSGELGEIEKVQIELSTPGPPEDDPRWSLELSGGATMDLGCYVLNAARQVGRWIGGEPSVVSAEAVLKAPKIDAAVRAELSYPSGATGSVRWDMNAGRRVMTWTVTGSAGTATSPAFAVPHQDNRVLISRGGRLSEETLGDATSYTYQLAAFAESVRTGEPFLIDIDDSVANAELIDAVYRAAELPPRGARSSQPRRAFGPDGPRPRRSRGWA
jgi:predicted dehydrogenase